MRFFRKLFAALATIIVVLGLFGLASPQARAEDKPPHCVTCKTGIAYPHGGWAGSYTVNSDQGPVTGYCSKPGAYYPDTTTYSASASGVSTTADARAAGYLIWRYENSTDAEIHAAVAMLIHRYIAHNNQMYNALSYLQPRADELWTQAQRNAGPYTVEGVWTQRAQPDNDYHFVAEFKLKNELGYVDLGTQQYEVVGASNVTDLSWEVDHGVYRVSGRVVDHRRSFTLGMRVPNLPDGISTLESAQSPLTQSVAVWIPALTDTPAFVMDAVSQAQTYAFDTDDEDKYVLPGAKVTDQVSYSGLEEGTSYVFSTTLMRKIVDENGAPVLEADGRQKVEATGITARQKFTASDAFGVFTLAIEIPDDYEYRGEHVFFEQIDHNGKTIVNNDNPDNPGETVYIATVGTRATDPADGDQILNQGTTAVNDYVDYQGLRPDVTYRVESQVFSSDDAEGTAVASSTLNFTPQTPDGTVETQIALPQNLAAGRYFVTQTIYEENDDALSDDGDATDTPTPAVVHNDPDESSQWFYLPQLATQARDQADGDQIVKPAAPIVDRVHFDGLEPQRAYTVQGEAMIKRGNDVIPSGWRSEITFTAEESSGDVDVVFNNADDRLAGETLVFYEYLYSQADSDTLIASHDNPEAAEQTITVEMPIINTGFGPGQPQTGDFKAAAFVGALCLVMAVAAGQLANQIALGKRGRGIN